MTVSIKRRP